MRQRKQSTLTYPIVFAMFDNSDHMTGKTGLTPTVTFSKNGGAFGLALGAVSEIGNGWYKIDGNATDRNTLGNLILHAEAPGADDVDLDYEIIPDPSVEIDTQLSSTHGSGTWGTGVGSSSLDVTVTSSGEPIEGIMVEVYTSSAKTGFVRKTTTDGAGLAHFDVSAGTYYVWVLHSDYTGTNPTTVTVT